MARRGRASPAEDIMHIVAMLPWWGGVVLAMVTYLLLHSVASQQGVAPAQPGRALVTQSLWMTLAGVGQYIVLIICLCGAVMSAWQRRARRSLVTEVTQGKAADVLDGMSWREFEMLVGEGFRLQGYRVVETGGGGADGGVDLVLTKPGKNGGEKFLVQCKQWRAFKVGVDVVRELYGVMAAWGAAGGVRLSQRTLGSAVESQQTLNSDANKATIDAFHASVIAFAAVPGIPAPSPRAALAPPR